MVYVAVIKLQFTPPAVTDAPGTPQTGPKLVPPKLTNCPPIVEDPTAPGPVMLVMVGSAYDKLNVEAVDSCEPKET